MASEFQREIGRMLDRVALHGPNADAAAVSLLDSDLGLDEIETAAQAIAAKAAEARDRRLYSKGEASARRLLGK